MKVLEERRPEIDDRIEELLEGDVEPLYDAARHLVEAGGKRHRPVLTMLSAEAVGASPDVSVDAGAAVELVHTFSLVQDDIFDNDEMRRGVPSVHVEWGRDTAILASDLLFSKAFQVLSESDCEPGRVTEAVNHLSDGCNRITEGQCLDMSAPGDEEEYLAMIDRKTAELHAQATLLGGLVGGGTEEQVEALETFGRKAGIAFQIKDDLLDITADSEDLGKPSASDLLEGKRTIIVLHAEEHGSPETRELLDRVLEDKEAVAVPDLVERLEEEGHLDYAEERADTLLREAEEALHTLPENDAREEMEGLAEYMVDRGH